jgi:hypothetical protein
MQRIFSLRQGALAVALIGFSGIASAGLTSAGIFTGNVGLSVDGIGGNDNNVGSVDAKIPVGATILKAYLYSAGVPVTYPNSPTTLNDYNTTGITLNGSAITNFDTLVGATSTRPDITGWKTARADVTSLVQNWTAGAATDTFSWAVTEGTRNSAIDGEVLAIVYSHASRPTGSVVLLNGGQNTGGETTTVNFGSPISNPNAVGFAAEFGLGISFSCCGDQISNVDVNGQALTRFAGNHDDGLQLADGSLITVGGLGDDPANNVANYDDDDELYDLRPYLQDGDTSFSIFTRNPTDDDNIFFASLYITAEVSDVNNDVPEPGVLSLMLAGLGIASVIGRRRRV